MATKKKTEPVVEKDVPIACVDCNGTGLKDENTLCPTCKGVGTI